MANRQLVDYILSLQHTNFTTQQIHQTLIEVGWTERDVSTAFEQAQKEAVVPIQTDIRPHLAVAISVILLFIAIAPFMTGLSSPTGNVVGTASQETPLLAASPAPSGQITVLEEVESAPAIEAIPEEQTSAPAQTMLPPPPSQTPFPPATDIIPSQSCDSLIGFERDSCFSELAAAKLDIRICPRVRDSHTFTNCITTIAISTKNAALCTPILFKDECRTAYARSTGDTSACAAISDNAKRATCQNA